jgi:uncharacterized protein
MKFTITCRNDEGELSNVYYDNITGLLFDEEGNSYGDGHNILYSNNFDAFKVNQELQPIRKSNAPKVLKVQMGLSCNYECNYCLQRFVPHSDEKSKALVPSFIEKVKKNFVGEPNSIQLWGGEPLVYIKTMMPLVEELKKIYPNSMYSIITNGALLSDPLVDWIMDNDINVAISHDGPGQSVRGPDPFKDILAGPAIRRLYREKKAIGKPISINPMIHAQNPDREAVQKWIIDAIGDDEVALGEGAVIEVYDEGAKENSLNTEQDRIDMRVRTYDHILNHKIDNYMVVQQRMNEWLNVLQDGRELKSLGMKCGMDSPDNITVDLAGNVVTCQNVSSVATAPNGKSHLGGTIDALSEVKIETSVHFANRDHCSNCPVVQSCKGGCMYLVGDLFYASCNNTYSDHLPFLAASIKLITGKDPVYIVDEDNKLPLDRRDILGEGLPNV